MKKISWLSSGLLGLSFLLVSTPAYASIAWVPDPIPDSTTEVTVSPSDWFAIYDSVGELAACDSFELVDTLDNILDGYDKSGVITIVDFSDEPESACGTLSTAPSDPSFVASFTLFDYSEEEESSNGLTALVSSAAAGFTGAAGFTPASAVSWTGTNLTALLLGSGIALFSSLVQWIVALVIIFGVVWFARRAFRFFRH